MRSNVFFSCLLLVTASQAAPQLRHNAALRETVVLAEVSHKAAMRDSSSEPSRSGYTQNWAGAALSGTGFNSIVGTWRTTRVRAPPGQYVNAQDSYCASAWIGIDGRTCHTAVLQAGVDSCSNIHGASYSAWYKWASRHLKSVHENPRLMHVNSIPPLRIDSTYLSRTMM